jgi:hypothetical protein
LTGSTGRSIFLIASGDEPEVLNAYVKIEGAETRGEYVPEERKAPWDGVF